MERIEELRYTVGKDSMGCAVKAARYKRSMGRTGVEITTTYYYNYAVLLITPGASGYGRCILSPSFFPL